MNTDRNKKLALSRQSIRTLTASELQFAHGGEGGNGTGGGPNPGTCGHSHRTTKLPPPPPPPTVAKLA